MEALDYSIRTLCGWLKVRNGEEESFEYCKLLVQISSSRKIRVVILYRPPFSENHRVPMGTSLCEFSSYMESIILSNDHLLILGDFNIIVHHRIPSIKWFPVLLLPPGWDASPTQGYYLAFHSKKISLAARWYPIIHLGCVVQSRVKLSWDKSRL